MTDQELNEPQSPGRSYDRTGRLIAGASLVVAGLGLFALEALGEAGDAAVLFVIGAVFLAIYFMRRIYGLLVAGSITFGVGLGIVAERVFESTGDITVIGIGIGFVMIYGIDRATTSTAHWWPLIPGAILLIIGITQLAGSIGEFIWPALLIAAGVALLAGASRRRT